MSDTVKTEIENSEEIKVKKIALQLCRIIKKKTAEWRSVNHFTNNTCNDNFRALQKRNFNLIKAWKESIKVEKSPTNNI